MDAKDRAADMMARVEVLEDLDGVVGELMAQHESRRELWWPTDVLDGDERDGPGEPREVLRRRAEGIPDPCRVAVALGVVTEEGLPHFHRLLAVYLGDDTHWRRWNNLWTAEEDRHGVVLHDYCRESAILDQRGLDRLQFDYLRAGFHPSWDADPYRVFAYTTLQERATQVTHANSGRQVAPYEPRLAYIMSRIAGDEARHYAFYRRVFAEVLARDPDRALDSAAKVLPSIEMPGVAMPGFKEFADVVRRSGIYGPRDYLKIVSDQIEYWRIGTLTGLGEMGRRAQELILGIPERLERVAEHIERRSRSKTFAFDLVFRREFQMD